MDGSDPNPISSSNRKHQAFLDRLSNHQNRRRPEPEPKPGSESVSSFLSLFASSKTSIESDLSRSDPKPDIDKISASISDLERLLAESSYFLPSYELRSCLKSISDLKEALETLIPKKKFSFRKTPKSSIKPPPKLEERSNLEVPSVPVADSPGFRNRKGETLVKKFNGMGEFTLADLDSCEVYLKGKIRALFFNRITNCRIYCGPVYGSVLIEEVSGCLFMLASHQIRIHQAKETDFYLRVRSRPIIEDSSGVRFAPYRFCYQGIEEELAGSGLGEETGNWANVDDFKWLRAVQSPNWCTIVEDEWVDVVNASNLEEKCGDD